MKQSGLQNRYNQISARVSKLIEMRKLTHQCHLLHDQSFWALFVVFHLLSEFPWHSPANLHISYTFSDESYNIITNSFVFKYCVFILTHFWAARPSPRANPHSLILTSLSFPEHPLISIPWIWFFRISYFTYSAPIRYYLWYNAVSRSK